jgi:hypothetical protein
MPTKPPGASSFPFQQVEVSKPVAPHQFAPDAAQPSSVAVFPEEVGGFARAEITFPTRHFRGIVEGIVVTIGEVGHGPPAAVSAR